MSSPRDAAAEAVANTCRLSKQDFEEHLFTPAMIENKVSRDVSLEIASSIDADDLSACFELVQETSSEAYKASSRGWSPRAKLMEMKEVDMRYLLVRDDPGSSNECAASDPGGRASLIAFLSFMITMEEGIPVVYCYEIHVNPHSQGKGVGAELIRLMERIGVAANTRMAMLTVFTSNKNAIRFYERHGYRLYDEEAVPPPKLLRTGHKQQKKPSYIILAKDLC